MTEQTCFVVMPISDHDDYDPGHFGRVYRHLIEPACARARLSATRADDTKHTNFIMLEILHRIVTAHLVICDLSTRNPNVLYELGVRQAFDLPVVLMKNQRTDRIFDIQGIRTLDYDESLRIDTVERDVSALAMAAKATLENHDTDSSSLVRLLSIPRAKLQETQVSEDTSIILSHLQALSERLSTSELRTELLMRGGYGYDRVRNHLAQAGWKPKKPITPPRPTKLPNGELAELGEMIFDSPGGRAMGKLMAVARHSVVVSDSTGEMQEIPVDDDRYSTLTHATGDS